MKSASFVRALAALCLIGALVACGGDDNASGGSCKTPTPGLRCAP